MGTDRTRALADRLDRFDQLVEVGIGERTGVAEALTAAGCTVTATDIVERSVPAAVRFVVDDVTDPTLAVYDSADAIYGLRLPPELQRPAYELTQRVDARLFFTTLGGDPAVVPVTREQVPGTTLYRGTLTR